MPVIHVLYTPLLCSIFLIGADHFYIHSCPPLCSLSPLPLHPLPPCLSSAVALVWRANGKATKEQAVLYSSGTYVHWLMGINCNMGLLCMLKSDYKLYFKGWIGGVSSWCRESTMTSCCMVVEACSTVVGSMQSVLQWSCVSL